MRSFFINQQVLSTSKRIRREDAAAQDAHRIVNNETKANSCDDLGDRQRNFLADQTGYSQKRLEVLETLVVLHPFQDIDPVEWQREK
ncbi:MAG: hypothetical protein AAGA75_09405 [Cyanobacteria bacterium P01_E01_bin.6]